ncbi:HD domain-containing phosphohydrolase [Janthinobacterium sp. 17J80-10]|uniref:HD domain-containing phosphohydrolase n=1 Tax=Janthinobacterium sp. 17J80-10 TaxID=2497863 RepID=UPI00100563D5|nr:HD domain-containing phosphohydrolase [Janthinobacterium sp. 17J80-10]QAU33187.1 HD domain-containing protein [Janthinobacterium sp. 17J80-10]
MTNFLAILSGGGVILLIVAFFLVAGNFAGAYLSARHQHLFRNALFVVTAMAVLRFPLQVNGDVLLDQRGAILAVAAIFGGGPALAATAAAMLAYRAYLGGSAMLAGLLGIVFTFLVCGALNYWWRRRTGTRAASIGLIAVAGVMAGVCSALTLLLVPPVAGAWALFQQEGASMFLVQVVSTCLFGFLLKLHVERQHSSEVLAEKNIALRNTLEQAIGALSMAMMHRDPGVASHEKRVAELAAAIGTELGFEGERLKGLKLAALIHDIGKIQLPAEILMRPRKLSEEEFSLVQLHAENGYQILKEIEFPWPLAEIIRQHHEDYDGGGYPRGLAGAQILLEARIIRVADSMEAMLSHRPFRRAYDVEYAAARLQVGEQTLYDPEVVKACLRLVRDQGFPVSCNEQAA